MVSSSIGIVLSEGGLDSPARLIQLAGLARERARATGAAYTIFDPEMQKQAGSFDFILNTVAVSHNLDQFTVLLKRDGLLCLVGAPEAPHASPSIMPLLFKRRGIVGSLIGGLAETQEMLDFCGKHGIVADIELIRMDEINVAYDRILTSDVKYRFVIDMATL